MMIIWLFLSLFLNCFCSVNYFDALPTELVGEMVQKLFLNKSIKQVCKHCVSFFKTCKRFNSVGKIIFVNNLRVINYCVERSGELKNKQVHAAAQLNAVIFLQELFDKNNRLCSILVNKTNQAQETPLYIAAQHNSLEAAQLLINNGSDVNATNILEETPFFCAVEHYAIEVGRLLVAHHADISRANLKDEKPCALVHRALRTRGLTEKQKKAAQEFCQLISAALTKRKI